MEKRAWIATGVCFVITLFLIVPVKITAVRNVCSANGYSIVYINGIFTSKEKAQTDLDKVFDVFRGENPNILIRDDFHLGYNQTHIGGLGDLFKSIRQKMWEVEGRTEEDFDLLTIARQLEDEVKTQKILIIGHSQGTFYANALYDYLIRRGTPAGSLSVYNIATPGSYVAGHGRYLTNENDAVINNVRKAAEQSGYPSPLPANTDIPARPEDAGNEWAGHSISNVYLAERPTDVASTMSFLLSRLTSDPTRDSGQPCIPPPEGTISYFAKKIAFGVTDPIGSAARPVIVAAGAIGNAVANPLFVMGKKLANILSGGAFADALTGQAGAQRASAIEAFDAISREGGQAFLKGDGSLPVEADREFSSSGEGPDVVTEGEDSYDGLTSGLAVPTVTPITSILPPPVVGFVPGGGAWGGGGGGGGGSSAPAVSSPAVPPPVETPTSTPETEEPEPSPPAPPPEAEPEPEPIPLAALSVASPQNNLNTNDTTPAISGTADPSAVVTLTTASSTATTTAGSLGAWSFDLAFDEGEHTLLFSALNATGATSTTIARDITIDVTPPAAPSAPHIAECDYSLTSGICFIPETAGTATWNATEGAVSYAVYVGSAQAATTSGASASISLPDSAESSITMIASDAAGNKSATSSAVSVTVMSRPVIINEVAWAGTTASGEDEWIELKNLSDHTIDMERLALSAADGSPGITLTGMLAASTPDDNTDLYLVERRSSATTADHDKISLFEQLADSGEELRLVHGYGSATTTVDQTPAVATCSGWCAGSLPVAVQYSPEQGTITAALSMERTADVADGALASSWRRNDGYTKSASDVGSNAIYGTPERDNSAGLPSAGWYCSPDTSSVTAGSTYLPTGTSCRYLSGFMHPLASRWGFLFRGTPGNAEDRFAHSIGRNDSKEEMFGAGITGSAGDNFFVAIFETRTFGDDLADFTNWFKYGTTTTGSLTPPHANYRIIEWVYGP